MENMKSEIVIDLHTHILPQMDDGSQDVNTSVALLHLLWEQGVHTVCATSHYYAHQECMEQFLQRRRQAVFALGDALGEAGVEEYPSIRLGAEVAYFPGISQCPELEQLCLGGTRTLLLELSYTQWTPQQVEEVASLSLDRGYQVILAHPERFSHMRSYWKDMERMMALPIALQINADSLLHWGSRKLALELLNSTPRPLLASDCHNLTSRPPRLEKARLVVRKKLGVDILTRIDETALRFTQPTGG
ncbi:hypothetical protein B5F98_09330 [Pseudoflavonifractor sp. An44]|uniref:CpsB/CapC family capsule biosynthesis tyrosine phosphatase n=1 Tax=Pseudoflavonifractor sp. An44 TaxID=1965635 RepID=UPI000B38A2E6|nr:CpsB/CapC family capsule biosynthesis tyrosine phosphatase [Pseudoflavonifractor sp. An44]OUN95459.1 hypothetical protein B5F98_09330 [Pseudoflavonifractor sp. An44]